MAVPLNSPEFLLLCGAAILLLSGLRGRVRDLAFAAVNGAFLLGLLLTTTGFVAILVFTLTGYVLARLVAAQPRAFWPALAAYALAFVYMRDYSFLHLFLPEGVLTNGRFALVGLSFLFFKVVHVLIEARSGTMGALHFPVYMHYSLSFATFMMGPIQRYPDFAAQWHGGTSAIAPTLEAHLDAVLRILVGLAKAYVLAGFLDSYVLTPGSWLLEAPRAALALGVVAFYFYLYLTFAGYCDVAIGTGSLLGVRPPENFDRPFLARNISDFWTRFHHSLTSWLTDYVFSPTYRSALRAGPFARRPDVALGLSLLVTMLVSGLWHGTTLSFLLFGLTHGIYFAVFRGWESWATRRFGRKQLAAWRSRPLVQAAGIALTFSAVALSLVFFQLDARNAFLVLERLLLP